MSAAIGPVGDRKLERHFHRFRPRFAPETVRVKAVAGVAMLRSGRHGTLYWLGRSGIEGLRLSDALSDSEPLVRGHAAWALGQVDSESARAAMSKSLAHEGDASVRTEIEAALWPSGTIGES
jgi:hypothetical protein